MDQGPQVSPDPAQAVSNLVAHVREQESAREATRARGVAYAPTEDEKAQRGELMERVLQALELSRTELQMKLGIDRATWDRWRGMTTVPSRSYLETLARFAREQASDPDRTSPRPLDMLSATPRTWGRLRLVFSWFRWRNAILHFARPYVDPETATEIALLALRGCRVVYMTAETDWLPRLVQNMTQVLGRTYTARALSQVCVIKLHHKRFGSDEGGFALFNYETSDEHERVGYIWHGNPAADRPDAVEGDLYSAVPGFDDLFTELKAHHADGLNRAFDKIRERVPQDFWAPTLDVETQAALLSVPVLDEATGAFSFVGAKDTTVDGISPGRPKPPKPHRRNR